MPPDQTIRPLTRLNTDLPIGGGLHGDLAVPTEPIGVTLFAHGSGSSRFSPRNRLVADVLNRHGIATLLFDLLTPSEAATNAMVFDVALLAGRLEEATHWVLDHPLAQGLAPAYFGASTGAAAALGAVARLGPAVRGVVSRGGRPDLAGAALRKVTAPTLLVVGADDLATVDHNRQALESLRGERILAIVRGAGHLFEEPGTLERVADLAAEWLACGFVGTPLNLKSTEDVEIVRPE